MGRPRRRRPKSGYDPGRIRIRDFIAAKTAIFEILPLKHDRFPGLIAEIAPADSDGDGVISSKDEIELAYIGFSGGGLQTLSFEGWFLDFVNYRENSPYAYFKTGLDLDSSGAVEPDYEPKRLYQFDVEKGQTKPVIPADLEKALQGVLDAGQGR